MGGGRLRTLAYRYATLGLFASSLIPALLLASLTLSGHPTAARLVTIAGFLVAGVCALAALSDLAPNKRESTLFLEINRFGSQKWLIAAGLYAVRIFLNDPLPEDPMSDAAIYFLVGWMMGLALTENVSLYLGSRYEDDGFLEWRVLRFPYSIVAMARAVFGRNRG